MKLLTTQQHAKRRTGGIASFSGAAYRSAAPTTPASPAPSVLPCACGGTCPRCHPAPAIQAKLVLSKPQDASEREAERAAEDAVRIRDLGPDASGRPSVSGRVPAVDTEAGEVPPVVRAVLASPGQPLDAQARAFFEERFDENFSEVRVHTDAGAARSTRALRAKAYTAGRDIVFGAGQYSPGASSYKRLLAHELTHVLQQRSAAPSTPRIDSHQRDQSGPASPVLVQRAEGPGEPDTVPDETPPSSTWAIADPKVAGDNAGVIRDPDKGFSLTRERIPIGAVVLPKEYKEESGKTYAKVNWSGTDYWVLASDLAEFDETYATPVGKTDGKTDGLFKKEGSVAVSPETRSLDNPNLEQYRRNVEAFLEGKALTPNQRELLERAKGFVDDGSETPEKMDQIQLDPELLSRIKTFYRFLRKEDLTSGTVVSEGRRTAGARTQQEAHILSTKWMLNNKNKFLTNDEAARIEFARQLVEINGIDRATSLEWATAEQVKTLSDALVKWSYAQADYGIAVRGLEIGATSVEELWADSTVNAILKFYRLTTDTDYKESFERQEKIFYLNYAKRSFQVQERPSSESAGDFPRFLAFMQSPNNPYSKVREINELRLTIDTVIISIRNRFTNSEPPPQESRALEGYEKNSADAPFRYPNVMNVGVTEHLTGDATDIHFDFKFNYYDPIVDYLGLVFGLRRPEPSEYWHYEMVGQPFNGTRQPSEQAPEPVSE